MGIKNQNCQCLENCNFKDTKCTLSPSLRKSVVRCMVILCSLRRTFLPINYDSALFIFPQSFHPPCHQVHQDGAFCKRRASVLSPECSSKLLTPILKALMVMLSWSSQEVCMAPFCIDKMKIFETVTKLNSHSSNHAAGTSWLDCAGSHGGWQQVRTATCLMTIAVRSERSRANSWEPVLSL